ncbi:MAG: transcription-repair coupling factor [Phycisphaeraceae bacterium]|nr:transcription-repair coupling factor [Phycisphaeraceae bacterium]
MLHHLRGDDSVSGLIASLRDGRRTVVTGSAGSLCSLMAGAVADALARVVVLVLAHIDDADEAVDELASQGVPAVRFPALEVLPGETGVALDLFAERLSVERLLLQRASTRGALVVAAPIQALMQSIPAPDRLDGLTRVVSNGDRVGPVELTRWLAAAGYQRRDAVEEPGDFAVRGGILDIFPPGGTAADPVRIDFFGDVVEKINVVDVETMGSDRAVREVQLVCADLSAVQSDDRTVNLLDLLPTGSAGIIAETLEVVEQGRGYFERVIDGRGIHGPPAVLKRLEALGSLAEINQFSAGAAAADTRLQLPAGLLPSFSTDTATAMAELVTLARDHGRAQVWCRGEAEKSRLLELIAQHAPASEGSISAVVGYLHRGFVWDPPGSPDGRVAVVTYHELVNRFTTRRRAARIASARAMDTFLDFQPGDFVVHADHGIARYAGLVMLKPQEVTAEFQGSAYTRPREAEEYLTLEFAGRTKLHVPVSRIDLVQRYVGGFSGRPPLSTIGGRKWKNQKERALESVRDLAGELLRVRAAREHMPGIAYPADTPWQRRFEEEFAHDETEDQVSSLLAIKRDMSTARPMDRLVCGDVGFGKTELAIRAAFKACEFGRQVAVLVPTTVLAEQHERTFRSRFAGYPFRIESLSRFKSEREQNRILEDARAGRVDVIIGTHRLLSADVVFGDLGLVVIDEEQRFGVEHKERLLRLRLTVDVLTLSATPIPRTLHMAMLGIRDISSLTTPPADRRAIVTEVIPFNERRVSQAISRELARDGQVYVVHNRVGDIASFADRIRALSPPGARVVHGHGQMPGHELEEVMLRFFRREADILVSTTIIESGLDVPTANTIIIDDADRFGLAELHQLRGRVGRSRHRAYCYLLLPTNRTVKEVAQKRLRAIEQFAMLGAGFKIAMRDLEIRGAGNILGAEQSGHIAAVGYEMYCRLLESAVRDLRREKRPEPPSAVTVEIGVSGFIPKAYIPSDQRRLEAYRRAAVAATADQIRAVREDLTEAYGPPPTPVERLLELAELRIAAAELACRSVVLKDKDVIFRTGSPESVAGRLRAGTPPGQRPSTSAPEGAGRAARSARAGSSGDGSLPGRITVLPPRSGDTLHEVYFRPPENYLAEPETLLSVVRRRLAGPGAQDDSRNEIEANHWGGTPENRKSVGSASRGPTDHA